MEKTRILITVAEAGKTRLSAVGRALKKQGVEIDSTLEAVGIMTGSIEKARLATLKPGKGVTVEIEQGVQLAPPSSPLQ